MDANKMQNSRKKSRSENKKNKMRSLVDWIEKSKESDDPRTSISEESASKKIKTDDDSKCNKTEECKPNEAQTSNITQNEDSNLDDEFRTLQSQVRKIKTRLKVPLMVLKSGGSQASLTTHVDERVPILFTDIQHLLLNSILCDESPYLPLRWCHLQKCKAISHTVVVVVNGMSLYDYSSRESLFDFNQKFEHSLEVVTPSLYKGCVVDELAVVPLSDIEKDSLIKTYGSMNVALETRKDLMVMMRAIFPIKEGLRPKLSFDKLEDKFSRTQLVLSAWQLTEENYPVPLKGKLKSLYSDYKMTKDSYEPVTAYSPMFGLDCEMCRTRQGNELTRISIIDEDFKIIYDKYVLPYNKIVDYLTPFSGITKQTLSEVTTRLEDVQKDLKELLPPNAILVGQSLNFDLHALKMMHPYIIDTSIIYNVTGEKGRKTKLKDLAQQFLGKSIQTNTDGHCSIEDALTSLKLVKLKLSKRITFGDIILKRKEKVKSYDHLKTMQNEYVTNIFNQVVPKNKSCLIVSTESIVNRYKRYIECFDEVQHKDKIKMLEEDNNESIVKHICDSCKENNLTLAHINIEKDKLDQEETYIELNKHLSDIWAHIESKCLSLVIFSGNQICNGVLFAGVKKSSRTQ